MVVTVVPCESDVIELAQEVNGVLLTNSPHTACDEWLRSNRLGYEFADGIFIPDSNCYWPEES